MLFSEKLDLLVVRAFLLVDLSVDIDSATEPTVREIALGEVLGVHVLALGGLAGDL